MFTLPAWAIVGSISSNMESKAGVVYAYDPDRDWWRNLTRYARYPQGIPKEVNRDSLWMWPKPRPIGDRELEED